MTSTQETAFFPNPPKAENSGVDFLALGAVGERLIAFGLPGITNVTRFLRPYSVASWITWEYNKGLIALSGHKLTINERALFRRYREKVELIFSWANSDVVRSIGSRRSYPEHLNPVEMRFDNEVFGPPNQASWFAAAAYGPSFASSGGLGFISPHKGAYITTELGQQMAQALDTVLSQHVSAYKRISSLTNTELSRRDLNSLYDGLSLDSATDQEKRLFRAALYQEHLVGRIDGLHGNRATSLALMIRGLETAGPMEVNAVRQTMALGLSPKGKKIRLDDLEYMQKLWFVLSIRQLQRVALERLLRWFEITLAENMMKSCDLKFVQDAAASSLLSENTEANKTLVGTLMDKLKSELEACGGPLHAMLQVSHLNAFHLRDELENTTLNTHHKLIPSRSVSCLLYCAAITASISSGDYADFLRIGGRERISLPWFLEFITQRRQQTLTMFIKEVISILIYAQHLQVAATRVEEGKNKFRFAFEDTGLQLLISPNSVNAQLGTPDRIVSALLLMSDCNLISMDANGSFWAA
jgi:hypothetical protein